ncbi:MAG: HNH endonuclease signature motif containing protein [Smithella sp.]|jgi:hypothetical protein
MQNRYTEKQIEFLKKNYPLMRARKLTLLFNKKFKLDKTHSAIRNFFKNRNISCGRRKNLPLEERVIAYNPKQIKFIKKYYPLLSRKDLTIKFNQRFKTTKTEKQIAAFTKNHHIKSGRTGFFPKGHVPLNKLIKGISHGSCTSFTKGHIPANIKPLGYERLDNRRKPGKTNYIQIKVAEKNPYTGAPARLRFKHIVVWEKHYGPVPSGMVVIFKDSDATNCAIENLELVSRAELLRLNKYKYREMPEEIKPALLTMAKLEVKTFSLRK